MSPLWGVKQLGVLFTNMLLSTLTLLILSRLLTLDLYNAGDLETFVITLGEWILLTAFFACRICFLD